MVFATITFKMSIRCDPREHFSVAPVLLRTAKPLGHAEWAVNHSTWQHGNYHLGKHLYHKVQSNHETRGLRLHSVCGHTYCHVLYVRVSSDTEPVDSRSSQNVNGCEPTLEWQFQQDILLALFCLWMIHENQTIICLTSLQTVFPSYSLNSHVPVGDRRLQI
ncbi:rh193 [macacine betaherpesvirus 3]|uniref:Rh193 n=1 Tax=Rhesus cytomegalovirus (strain 68-1) TaxID=47929 RepID=Q7TFE9_RHCM6|nr:rh193 [macacine betaherpesvirus 3]AAP50715.1 rh193 [macacine betaherpesvirus 3]